MTLKTARLVAFGELGMSLGTLTLTNRRLSWTKWRARAPAIELDLSAISGAQPAQVSLGNGTDILISLRDGTDVVFRVNTWTRRGWLRELEAAIQAARPAGP